MKGICEGISYLHQIGLVHCDLKPHNILLSYDYTPKLADLGISKFCEEREEEKSII